MPWIFPRTRQISGVVVVLTALSILVPWALAFPADDPWEPLGGPGGGFVLSLAMSQQNPDVLYLGSDAYGGVYRSADGGQSWAFRGLLSSLGGILSLSVAPGAPGLVLAGTQEGVYRTANGGGSWTRVGLEGLIVYAVAFNPLDPQLAYAGVHSEGSLASGTQPALTQSSAAQSIPAPGPAGIGIFKSTDGGLSWSASGLEGLPVISILVHPDTPGSLYAGTGEGVYLSTNAGVEWTHLGPWAAVATLALDSAGTIFAGTLRDTADDGTVYRFTDGGYWEPSLPLGNSVYSIAVGAGATGIVYATAGEYLAGGEGLYRTTDSGDSWSLAITGLTDRMARAVIAHPADPLTAWAGTNGLGGMYQTTDGGVSWTASAAGLRHTAIQALCVDGAGDLCAASGWGTHKDVPCVWRSVDQGGQWEPLALIPGAEYMISVWDLAADPARPGEIYVSGMHHTGDVPDPGFLCRSTGGGSGWVELWNPEEQIVTCVAPLPGPADRGPAGPILAGLAVPTPGSVYGVYRSTDDGASWNPTTGWTQYNSVLSLAPHPADPRIVLAASNDGVFRSTDSGSTWAELVNSPDQAYTILFDERDPQKVYVGVGGPIADSGGVYGSPDGGESWSSLGLNEYSICALGGLFGPSGEARLFAGTGGLLHHSPGQGLFRSLDRGLSWERFDGGLDSPFLLALATDSRHRGSVYAATAGTGIYRLAEGPLRLAFGPGPGYQNLPLVRVFPPGQDESYRYVFSAYGAAHYGVNVGSGDPDGDSRDEIITGAGPGEIYGPHVRGFRADGTSLTGLSFLAYGTNRWGVNVAAGDLDGDGYDELLTGAGPGAVFGPHIRAFDYDGAPPVTPIPGVSFFAYGTHRWGVNVAAGDLDGDGYDEIVSGAGPGAVFGPHVRGWNVDGGTAAALPGVSFFAYGTNRFGVQVTCGDVDGDGIDEIVTGPGPGVMFGAHVRGWNCDGAAVTPLPGFSFFAWDPGAARYGARVSAGADLDDDGRCEIVVAPGPDPAVESPVRVYRYHDAGVTFLFSLQAFPPGWTHGASVTSGRFNGSP